MTNKFFRYLHLIAIALILTPSVLLAEPAVSGDSTDSTLASIDQQQQENIATEVKRAEEQKAGKIKKIMQDVENQEASAADVNLQDVAEPGASEPVFVEIKEGDQDLSKAPATGKQESPAVESGQNDLQRNWDEFFSTQASTERLLYAVQPGDSLYVVARKHRTTADLIKKLNGLESDVIYAGRDLRVFTGAFSILIDKSDNTLLLSASGTPIKRYPVSTGKNSSTPTGEFKIVTKLVDPTWFKTGAIYPPGSPENSLGTRWLGFDKPAYGIHGTIEPEKIGTQASEGCIRMLNADVEELYSMVPTGTSVIIQD